MPAQKLIVSNIGKGLQNDLTAFNIDNDAFPFLQNAYVWRGRVKRKRGTIFLGRLQRNLTSQSLGNTNGSGVFSGNIVSILSLQSNSTIVLGSVSIAVGAQTFTDNSAGVLSNGAGGTGTINYATGAITLQTAPVLAATAVTISFGYYPDLPAMGFEDFIGPNITSAAVPLAFDTVYSYQFNQSTNIFYDTSFYKSSKRSLVWSGADYQQFWTTNYSNTLWATNGKAGFHFKAISNVPVTGATTQLTITGHGLSTNDYIFVNEVGGITNLNGLGLRVNSVVDPNNITVVTPSATAGAYTSGGIAQYLTASLSNSIDGIRWYDGDPTQASPPNNLGWVNFAPPLSSAAFAFSGLTSSIYYLVGATAVLPFKDRLLFFDPWVQSSTGAATQLLGTVIYSQNGTPFYHALVPSGWPPSGYDVQAWYTDVGGKGGDISAGIDQPITTITNNEDVLIIGFPTRMTRFVFTGNDFLPFLFYSIDSQIGAGSTFSGVTLDKGAIAFGSYGITLTNQYELKRIDVQIPDQVFDVNALNNGVQRVNSARDFRGEWIYFSYPSTQSPSNWKFPTQTLFYNYRDQTWAVFIENFTTHGTYRRTSGYTWATLPFSSWAVWTEPWSSGISTAEYPSIVGGNQQGFFLIKGEGTGEGISGYIKDITTGTLSSTINSPNHCLLDGDYLYIQGCLGNTSLNGQIGRVTLRYSGGVADTDNFFIDVGSTGTYIGGGTFRRLSQPYIQTKQFPAFWNEGKKVRIGTQRYLFDRTAEGELTLAIFLSQDDGTQWNAPPIVPLPNVQNSSLIFTDTVFTSPETGNLLTLTSATQEQIWHRESTSLIGDTVQIGFTLSDEQMRDLSIATSEIVLHSMILDLYPSSMLI